MKKKSKIILITSIALIFALIAFSAYLRKDEKAVKGKNKTTVFVVESAKSKKGEIKDYIKINGNVEPVRNIDIYPDIAGKLSRLKVLLGESVKAGQIIAEIDPSKPGLSYALSPVRSTITGTITSLPYEVGATITLNTAVATVGDLSLLQIRTEVAEPYAGKINIGTPATASFVAWPNRTFNTHIVEISPIVSNITRSIRIKLEFDKEYPELKAGMFASIKLVTDTMKNTVLVPSISVVTRDAKKYVFVVQEKKASMVQVSTGLNVDGVTEITSGIPENTEIVVKGQNLLDDGVEIDVINKEGVKKEVSNKEGTNKEISNKEGTNKESAAGGNS